MIAALLEWYLNNNYSVKHSMLDIVGENRKDFLNFLSNAVTVRTDFCFLSKMFEHDAGVPFNT